VIAANQQFFLGTAAGSILKDKEQLPERWTTYVLTPTLTLTITPTPTLTPTLTSSMDLRPDYESLFLQQAVLQFGCLACCRPDYVQMHDHAKAAEAATMRSLSQQPATPAAAMWPLLFGTGHLEHNSLFRSCITAQLLRKA
jgi:hypothetical protein